MIGQTFKIFDKYDISQIEIEDPGLKNVINLEPKLILKSYGRNVVKFGQVRVNVVERLMNKVATARHRGKKHRIEKGNSSGKYTKNMKIVLNAFELIEKHLSPSVKQVFIQKYRHNLDHYKIAETLKIEKGTVDRYLSVGTKQIRELYDEFFGDTDE
jgi:small subunit ribosomal protein S7